MFEQLLMSYLASGAFGVIFQVPKRTLIQCGFAGMMGWMVYLLLAGNEVDPILATLSAAFVVAIISQLFARVYKTPIIVFNVSGIIPLVPGGVAYDAMRKFVEHDYSLAIQLAVKASMISGAIAVGLVFSEVFNQSARTRSPDR